MTRTQQRWKAIAVAVVLLAAAGGAAAWWSSRPAVAYQTETVARTDIESTVTAIGTLQPRRYVDVGAQVSGQVTRLRVEPGAQVEKGALLVEIDPSVQRATVDAGRASLAGLRAQLAEQQALRKLAEQQLTRQRQLARDGATREEDLQTAEANLAAAGARMEHLKAQIDQTQATLKADEARLGYTRIYAPMAGTVVSVEAREGQTLNATYQTPNILRIADLSAMTVWTEVSGPTCAACATTCRCTSPRWAAPTRPGPGAGPARCARCCPRPLPARRRPAAMRARRLRPPPRPWPIPCCSMWTTRTPS